MHFVEYLRLHWVTAVFGCVLYIFSIGILFWNEGRAVKYALSLDEALSNAISVKSSEQYNPAYEGRLVHINGAIITGEPLTEPEYGIQVQAVKLRKRVQMYQWVEEDVEFKYGESVAVQTEDRTYYYSMDWRDNLVDSSRFYIRTGHHNPTKFPIENRIQLADQVNIGFYELGDDVKAKMVKFTEITSDNRPDDISLKLHSGMYYHCNDVYNPEIGDLRVQFSFAGLEGTRYTVVGQLKNGKIVAYKSTVANVAVLIVFEGEHTLMAAFKAEHFSHKVTTWGFRFAGWLMLFFAITSTSNILHFVFSQNNILYTLAPDPVNPVTGNLTLSFSVGLIIVSIAWIFHRPWLGCGMILAAVSPFLFCARSIVQYQRIPVD